MLGVPAHRIVPVATILCGVVLAGCSGSGSSAPPSTHEPPPTSLRVTITSLPDGQVGQAYAATLTATGGTAPLSWAVGSGTLPAGLTLATNGTIAGTPSEIAAARAITFAVNDASTVALTQSVTLKLTVRPPPPPPGVVT